MELGLAFDDEDLEDNIKKTKKNQLVSYNAKYCPPKWYKDADISDNESAAQILKYRGDNSYITKEYAAAIDYYEEAIGRLHANNKGMRRELMEGQTRSYVALQQYKEALELAYQLKDDASSPDQHFQSLVLLTDIQEASQDWPNFEESVKQLICCHPHSGNLWRRLALCYWYRQHDQGTPGYYKLLTCLVRSRLLYYNVRRSVGLFVAERNDGYLKQIGQQISELNAGDELIQKAQQFLSNDMFKLEQQEGGDNSIQKQMDVKDFEKRWYSWADDILPT